MKKQAYKLELFVLYFDYQLFVLLKKKYMHYLCIMIVTVFFKLPTNKMAFGARYFYFKVVSRPWFHERIKNLYIKSNCEGN